MAILYKTFAAARIVFYAFLAFFMCFSGHTTPVWAAANPLFTVENVQVDVTAANALTARNEAFGKAQQEAYKKLLTQLLPAVEAAAMAVPDAVVIAPMIQDYEIIQEKLSSVRYIGTYTFRFKEKSVRKQLALYEGDSANTDVIAADGRPLLVLPFYQPGGEPLLWTGPNIWLEAWARSSEMGGIVPMVLPIGDLQDVKDIDDGQAMTFDEQRLQAMVQRYDAAEAVVVIAEPDSSLRVSGSDSSPAAGTLSINLYRTDRSLAEFTQSLAVHARPGETMGQVLDRAVIETQQALRRNWKNTSPQKIDQVSTVPDYSSQNTPLPFDTRPQESAAYQVPPRPQGNVINARVPFDSFQQWSSTQRMLRRVPGFRQMTIRGLSPREAQIEIIYAGDTASLSTAFKQAGLEIRPDQGRPSGYAVYQMQRLQPNMGRANPSVQTYQQNF
jgi:hypothetical protein